MDFITFWANSLVLLTTIFAFENVVGSDMLIPNSGRKIEDYLFRTIYVLKILIWQLII